MNKSNCFCEKCKYKAKCISDYKKHLLSQKHNNQEELESNYEYNYECTKCFKKYRSSAGLWYHNKTCNVVIQETSNDQEISNELKKQHQITEELKKLIIELINK